MTSGAAKLNYLHSNKERRRDMEKNDNKRDTISGKDRPTGL